MGFHTISFGHVHLQYEKCLILEAYFQFVLLMQTVSAQIRCHSMWSLIWIVFANLPSIQDARLNGFMHTLFNSQFFVLFVLNIFCLFLVL